MVKRIQRGTSGWIKASRSFSTGACVEVTSQGSEVLFRHSRRPRRRIAYSFAEFEAFLDGAKRGEFDHILAQMGRGRF